MLNNKNILITGASSGLGKQLAIKLASLGANLILLAKNSQKLSELYDYIANKSNNHKPKLDLVPIDFRGAEPRDYQYLYDLISKKYDFLDSIIHNAAQLGPKAPLFQYDIKKWFEVFQVNLHTPFLLTQALLPLLKKCPNKADLIFTLAPEALKAKAFGGAYSASKFALHSLMLTFSEELENNSNIRVNAINPQQMSTKIFKQNYPGRNINDLPSIESKVELFLQILTNNHHAKILS